MTIPQFRSKYEPQSIENSQFLENENVSLTGRIMSLRSAGAKLMFIDLHEDN
jgi:lysyl-tRNA synthetase class II